jgi:hypothetical protein
MSKIILFSKQTTARKNANQFGLAPVAIPEEGLELYLDASIAASYPGSGNSWFDLSGNSYVANLNNITFDPNVAGGVLRTSGASNSYGEITNIDLRSGEVSLVVISRYSGSTRGRMVNGRNNNWLIGQWGNSVGNMYAEGWVTGVGAGGSDTNWRIYTSVNTTITDTYRLYINGTLTAGPNNGGANAGPWNIMIGKYGTGSTETSTGEVAVIAAYRRLLSQDDITKIYDIFKNRFGL